MKVLAINPGSTSTKIALFEDNTELFNTNLDLEGIDYSSGDVETILSKLETCIVTEVVKHGYSMEEIDVYSGRSGYMAACEGGVYEITGKLEEDIYNEDQPRVHASIYSPMITKKLANRYGKKAYLMNSQSADELQLSARFTGYKGLWRTSGIHVLNHKAVAEMAAEKVGKRYDNAHIIVAHLGGGCSIVAHKNGRMVDYSGCKGEGPIQPNRSGTIAPLDLINICMSGEHTKKELFEKIVLTGGLKAQLGTANAIEVEKMIADGDRFAKDLYDSMIYQFCKYIGSMAVTLDGKVDAIAVTGGISNSKYVVESIRRQTEWIADVLVFPGEYEMQALAKGALDVCKGVRKASDYTGEPVFDAGKYLKECGRE